MNRKLFFTFAALLCCCVSAQEVKHRFLACCFSKGMIQIVAEDGTIERTIKGSDHVQDAWLLKNGNVLYSHYGGAREIDKNDKVVWEYKTKNVQVHSAQPLANGNVVIAESGASRIIEVDRSGKIVKEIKVETNDKSRHMQFRNCRKTPRGTYLIACLGDGVIKEVDGDGKVLRTLIPNKSGKPKHKAAHGVVELANGHILASTGYGKTFVEMNKDGKIIWELTQADLPKDVKLSYTCSIQQLPNGNRIVAVYHGNPQFFEVTQDKKVVWKYDNKVFGYVSGILIPHADPTGGKVYR